MKKIYFLPLFLVLYATYSQSSNLYKGFEKGELAIGLKGAYDFRNVQYVSISYAISNKFDMGIGCGNTQLYDYCYPLDLNVNYHFYPKKKFDFYLGAGASYYNEEYTYFYYSDTLKINPKTSHPNYLGGILSIGINYCFIKNLSLGLEYKERLLVRLGFVEGHPGFLQGYPFLGITFVF